jgi:hypothetical protein
MMEVYKPFIIVAVLVEVLLWLLYAKRNDGVFKPIRWWALTFLVIFEVGMPAIGGFFDTFGFWQFLLGVYGGFFISKGINMDGQCLETRYEICKTNTIIYILILTFGGFWS